MENLSPELFTFDNYDSNYWSRLGLEVFYKHCDLVQCITKKARGYCDGSRLSVRPRADSYGVMFEDEEGTFWFHIDKDTIDDILDGCYDERGMFKDL